MPLFFRQIDISHIRKTAFAKKISHLYLPFHNREYMLQLIKPVIINGCQRLCGTYETTSQVLVNYSCLYFFLIQQSQSQSQPPRHLLLSAYHQGVRIIIPPAVHIITEHILFYGKGLGLTIPVDVRLPHRQNIGAHSLSINQSNNRIVKTSAHQKIRIIAHPFAYSLCRPEICLYQCNCFIKEICIFI